MPKPRPCDVFDTIAGIGAGGWLAILLGRFHMDVIACLSEWYKIMSCIAPKSMSEEMRMRVLHSSYFDPSRLMHQIERLTKLYGTGENLIANAPDNVRTRHVFVAALKSDGSNYNLFRSYEIPSWAAIPNKLLEGPKDPRKFKISRAFGVTGATKYFSPPWKERMDKSGKMRFSDIIFPKPHNITELALNEMWGLYGVKVPLSVVVNIGPGLADPQDVRHIARRFSWGLNIQKGYALRPEPPAPAVEPPSPGMELSEPPSPAIEPSELPAPTVDGEPLARDASRLSRISRHGDKKVQFESSRFGSGKSPITRRRSTFGSIREQKIEIKLRRDERRIEDNIRQKLDHVYGAGTGAALYFRLALNRSPKGTARNDSEASDVCLDATNDYLNSPKTELLVKELVETSEKEAIRWSA